MIAKKVFSQFKALTSPSSILVSYSSSTKLPPFEHQRPDTNSRVCVWWDFGNCPVPEGVNISRVPKAIKAAVQANGMNGSVHISAAADVLQQPRATWAALASTDIKILHVPNGYQPKEHLLTNLYFWAEQIPPPARLFLITDWMTDSRLKMLRSMNYDILLASNEAPVVCPPDVSIVWRWSDFLKGEYLSGMRNDQVPNDKHCGEQTGGCCT